MKEYDFVFLVTSKKENIRLQEKVINSIIDNVPVCYSYDIHVETRGDNWNVGFKLGLEYIRDNYKLKYGVFTFDDDNYLMPGSFDGIDYYLDNFKHFQFREVDSQGKQFDYAVKVIRIPYFYLMVRNFLKGVNGFTVNPVTTLRVNDKVTESKPVLLCSPASMFLHSSLIPLYIEHQVTEPSVVFYEALIFSLHEFSRGVQPMIIPNSVLAGRGTTKGGRYGFYNHLASNYYFGWYLFSHPEFVDLLKSKGLFVFDYGFFRYSLFLVRKYLGVGVSY